MVILTKSMGYQSFLRQNISDEKTDTASLDLSAKVWLKALGKNIDQKNNQNA